MNVVKVIEVVKHREPYHGNYQGKPYVSYDIDVIGSLDNGEPHKLMLKTGKENIKNALAPGQMFMVEKKQVGYKIISEAGQPSGSGNTVSAASPMSSVAVNFGSRDKAIQAQTCLKCATEYVATTSDRVSYEIDVERIKSLASEMLAWVEENGR